MFLMVKCNGTEIGISTKLWYNETSEFKMRILGIDPGYAILGYGIIDMKGNHFSVCGYGAVTTDSTMEMPDRLKHLYSADYGYHTGI